MGKPKEETFSDFFLLNLSHPDSEEIVDRNYSVRRGASEKIERLIDYGKKAILDNTKEGDLIAIENLGRCTLKAFKMELLPVFQEKFGKRAEKRLNKNWWEIGRLFYNIYPELSEFAEKNRRKVISLESGMVRPGSRLRQAIYTTYGEPKTRVRFLVQFRRNISFVRRIQMKKPKMAIMHYGHGFYVEDKMKPKRVEFYPTEARAEQGMVPLEELREQVLRQILKEMEIEEKRYEESKRRRRERIREELWRKKPWWQKARIKIKRKLRRG